MRNENSLEEKVLAAQKDDTKIEELIREYTPFIKSTISKTLKRYVYSSDPEITTGMLGFHEAIETFDPKKGRFLSYAQMLIRSRIIDEKRKEVRQLRGQSLTLDDDQSEGKYIQIQDQASLEKFHDQRMEQQRKDDLVLYMNVLKDWGMSIADLVSASPQKQELLELYQSIAKHIAEDQALLDAMRESKRLPGAYILSTFAIDRKRLDRGRKYIIAVAELWAGDFDTLHEYLKKR